MLSVFFPFVFFVSGPASFAFFFAALLFLGSLFEKISGVIVGSKLLFLGVGFGLVFFGGFLPLFLFFFVGSLPKVFGKSLDVRSAVFGGSFSLPLVFFVDVVLNF